MESNTKVVANVLRYLYLEFEYQWWSSHGHKKQPGTFSNILVVELKYIGDIIAITPAIRGLKEKFPAASITVWTLNESKDILWGNPNIKKIITEFDDDKYDLLVVFHAGTNWDALGVWPLVRQIPFKIGVTRAGVLSSHFTRLDRKTHYPYKFKHIIEDNLDVIRLVGAAPKDQRYEVYTPVQYENQKPTVILHPGSKKVAELKNSSHMWPIDRWIQVAKYLIDVGYQVELTGSGKEQVHCDAIQLAVPQVINSCNKLSIHELVAHIKAAKMMVSIDTGPAHIAEAVGTPLIMLMGPQDPDIWGTISKQDITLYHDEVCTKCKRLECSNRVPLCMNAISTDEVLRAINDTEIRPRY